MNIIVTRINEDGEKTVSVDVIDIDSIQLSYKGCTINLVNGKRFLIKERQAELEAKIREAIRGK